MKHACIVWSLILIQFPRMSAYWYFSFLPSFPSFLSIHTGDNPSAAVSEIMNARDGVCMWVYVSVCECVSTAHEGWVSEVMNRGDGFTRSIDLSEMHAFAIHLIDMNTWSSQNACIFGWIQTPSVAITDRRRTHVFHCFTPMRAFRHMRSLLKLKDLETNEQL